MRPNDSAGAAPVLVYDGECGFCSRAVQALLRRDPGGSLRFASRSGEAGRAVRERHVEFRDVEALLWVEREAEGERVYAGADATIRALRYLGGSYAMLGRIIGVVPGPLRDVGYRIVARVRRRLSGPVDPSCIVPSGSERLRFLP